MQVRARERAATMGPLRAGKLARSALNGRTDLARCVQRMGEPMQAPGDCARRGGRRLAGPRSGRAIVVDDRMCALLGCRREIAERPFDVGEDTREVSEPFGVVSLHAQSMRDLGEAPGQAAQRAGLRRCASRSKGVALDSEGSGARRGRGSGGHDGDGRRPATRPQWALNPTWEFTCMPARDGPAWAGRCVQRRRIGPRSLNGPRPVRACDCEPAAHLALALQGQRQPR
jgi:hypothetical protein